MEILVVLFSFFSSFCPANNIPAAEDNPDWDFISYSVMESSWLSLSGTTNINSFECLSSGEDTNGQILINLIDGENSISFSDAGIILDINSFDCKNQMITRDMHKALGGSGNPGIEIKLLDAVSGHMNWYSANGKIRTNVIITLNDNSVTRELDISWQRTGGFQYQFEGSTELLMSEFEIDPPSPALGLVRVDDKIIVNFNYNVQTSAISRIELIQPLE
jgi:hypothetical protein